MESRRNLKNVPDWRWRKNIWMQDAGFQLSFFFQSLGIFPEAASSDWLCLEASIAAVKQEALKQAQLVAWVNAVVHSIHRIYISHPSSLPLSPSPSLSLCTYDVTYSHIRILLVL